MKRMILPVLAAMALLGGNVAAVVAAPESAAVRKELEAEYARMAAAFKKKDAAELLSTMAPDAVAKLPGGKVLRRSDFDAAMKDQMASIKTVKKMSYKIDSLSVNGTTAVAKVTGSSSVIVADGQGKDHQVDQINTVRNTWVKSAAGWRIKIAEPLKLKVLVDGKPQVAQP